MVYSRRAMSAAAAVVTCGVLLAGCGSEGEDERTSTSSGSAQPEYDEKYLLGEITEIDKRFQAQDPNKPIPANASWATDNYRKVFNDDLAEWKKQGVVQKGKVRTTGIHIATSDPDAPGGWDLAAYVCVTSEARLYIDGEDVSADPEHPDKPLPKGPIKSVALDSYVTSDGGKTWRLDDSETLTDERAKDTPCSA